MDEDDYWNIVIDDNFEAIDDMADVRYQITSDAFVINTDYKLFEIQLDKLVKLVTPKITANPWPTRDDREGENSLGSVYPKIEMVSSKTNKKATFFLAEVNVMTYRFKPSKGTVLQRKIGGWVLEVYR